jgi:hypothetical protein
VYGKQFEDLTEYIRLTGRFESKHRVAKSTAESAKNVINVTKTIAERQQMRSASVFYRGMFNYERFSLPGPVTVKHDIKDTSQFNTELKAFMNNSGVICNEVFVNNQVYKNGDLLVLHVTDYDNITTGVIQTILVQNNKVFFVLKAYECARSWLQYFESKKKYDTCVFKESSKLSDYKPLAKRGTERKFIFVLHHNLSFVYK